MIKTSEKLFWHQYPEDYVRSIAKNSEWLMLINNNSSVMIFHLLVFNKIFFYSIRNSIGNSYFDINHSFICIIDYPVL